MGRVKGSRNVSTPKTANIPEEKLSKSLPLVIKLLEGYFAERKEMTAFEAHINEHMAAYEETEKKRREAVLARAEKPDEDGFITVVSKKPKVFEGETDPVLAGPETAIPFKPLPNFYRWTGRQQDQQRAHQLEALRKKFEEDKQRLAELKKSKIFQPL